MQKDPACKNLRISEKVQHARTKVLVPPWEDGTVVWFETTTYTNISLQRLIGHPKKEKQKSNYYNCPPKNITGAIEYKNT